MCLFPLTQIVKDKADWEPAPNTQQEPMRKNTGAGVATSETQQFTSEANNTGVTSCFRGAQLETAEL